MPSVTFLEIDRPFLLGFFQQLPTNSAANFLSRWTMCSSVAARWQSSNVSAAESASNDKGPCRNAAAVL